MDIPPLNTSAFVCSWGMRDGHPLRSFAARLPQLFAGQFEEDRSVESLRLNDATRLGEATPPRSFAAVRWATASWRDRVMYARYTFAIAAARGEQRSMVTSVRAD
ncbi:MAG: hypothetical protein WBF21_23600 [Steroidobacteraceae bacterium]